MRVGVLAMGLSLDVLCGNSYRHIVQKCPQLTGFLGAYCETEVRELTLLNQKIPAWIAKFSNCA